MASTTPGLDEMGELPALIVVDGPPEENARIAGTGIDCFAVYRTFRELDRQWEALRQAFHWLTEAQLRAALDYADAHPEAMRRRWAADQDVDKQLVALWRRHPHTSPDRR
jgi:uncharacterized protein (DUF433 family)